MTNEDDIVVFFLKCNNSGNLANLLLKIRYRLPRVIAIFLVVEVKPIEESGTAVVMNPDLKYPAYL